MRKLQHNVCPKGALYTGLEEPRKHPRTAGIDNWKQDNSPRDKIRCMCGSALLFSNSHSYKFQQFLGVSVVLLFAREVCVSACLCTASCK